MNINEKVIIITGAAQGLGQTTAVSLASKGAHLALIDLNIDAIKKTQQLCINAGGDAHIYQANVANQEQVTQVFDEIILNHKEIHGLINNAGITRDAMLIKKTPEGHIIKNMSIEQWQNVIDVNLTGVFLCGQAAAVHMVEKNTKGVIINIASISKSGNIGQSNYSAAKAGVAALTVTWAKELARYGIRVAGIAPGFMATEMTQNINPKALDQLKSMIPLERMGQPQEIAHSAIYIFENDFYTGRILEIDGGMRL